jgi:hypothetical protein
MAIETVYVRTIDGWTGDMPVDTAVRQWLGNDGYRITIKVGSFEFVLHRNIDSVREDHVLGSTEVADVLVTVKKSRIHREET